MTRTSITTALNAKATMLKFTSKSVATSAWSSDTTYSDYPYRASVSCSGVTSSYFAEVVFSPSDATSGNYAPICVTGSSIVYIYAKEKPSASITIPSIVAFYVA
jgi:hypothetical protein